MSPEAALLRFHLASGVRIASRALTGPLVIVGVALGVQQAPGRTILALGVPVGAGLAGAPARYLLAAAALLLAQAASMALRPSLYDWHRHLPVSGRSAGRILMVATLATQLPVAVLWLALWIAGGVAAGALAWSEPVFMLLACVCAALSSMPEMSRGQRLLGLVGLAGVATGLAAAGALGAALVLGLAVVGPKPAFRRAVAGTRAVRTSGMMVPALMTWRAVGRATLGAYLYATLPVAIAWFLIRNNPVSDAGALAIVRTALALSAWAVLVSTANRIRTRRPGSRWLRSLPWSAGARILHDVVLLASFAAPLLAAMLWWNMASGLALAVVVAYTAVRLAGAIRTPAGDRYSFGLLAGLELLAFALAIGMTAWTALGALLLLPVALRRSRTHEQNLPRPRLPMMAG